MIDQQIRHHSRQPPTDICASVEAIPVTMKPQERLLSQVPRYFGITGGGGTERDQPSDVLLETGSELRIGHPHISLHGSPRPKVPQPPDEGPATAPCRRFAGGETRGRAEDLLPLATGFGVAVSLSWRWVLGGR